MYIQCCMINVNMAFWKVLDYRQNPIQNTNTKYLIQNQIQINLANIQELNFLLYHTCKIGKKDEYKKHQGYLNFIHLCDSLFLRKFRVGVLTDHL